MEQTQATLDKMEPADIMQLTPDQFDALAWVGDQCEDCPLVGQCDTIARELCGGALVVDNVSE
jgi:hypothetical protein